MTFCLLGFGFGQKLQLVLKIDNSFLVFFAKHVSGFLRFKVDILQKFAQLSQLIITLLVDNELKSTIMMSMDICWTIIVNVVIEPDFRLHLRLPQGAPEVESPEHSNQPCPAPPKI